MKIHRPGLALVSSSNRAGKVRQVSYTRLGQHRGQPRLWMEGLRLSDCGFDPGTKFRVELDLVRRQVRLVVDPMGDRTVSGRKRQGVEARTPIVDVTGGALAEVLGEGARIRAAVSRGQVVFDLHPVELAVEAREKRLRRELAAGEVTEASLCAGVGVAALALHSGLEDAGVPSAVEWVVDRDGRYLQLAAENNPVITPLTLLFEATLEEVETADLPEVSVLQVSLPCTGHSTAGKSKRGLKQAEDHPTDALAVFGLLRILERVNPSVVVSENVVGARDSASYALVRAYLHEQGYAISEAVLDGQQAGTIEDRQRWWLCAVSRGLAAGFDMTQVKDQPREYRSLGEALNSVEDEDSRWKRYDYLVAKAIRDAAEGKGFKRQLVDGSADRIGTIGRGYAKVRSTEAQVVHPSGDGRTRLLDTDEHARVKGIPPGLVAGAGATLGHEVLGQSILFGHARGIGQALGKHLRGLVESERITDEPESAMSTQVRR